MKSLKRGTLGALLIALAAGLAVVGLIIFTAWGHSARANPGLVVGLDGNPSATPANTATSLGSREACITKSVGQTFDLDITVAEVANLKAWEATINYNPSVLKVINKNVLYFLAAGGGNVWDASAPVPDQTGDYQSGAVDLVDPGTHSGSGVLTRLTLQAVGTGVSPLTLYNVSLEEPGNVEIGDADHNGWFDGPLAHAAVGVGTPLPDGDTDGICDAADNCPTVNNPGQQDGDNDGFGDACDVCPAVSNPGQEDSDSDGDGNVCDNCPVTSNPDQSDVDLDLYGDVCDDDADGDGFWNTKENNHGSNWLNPMCGNAANDDSGDDTKVNDGCPPRGTAESGAQCDDALDNDSDGKVNDGCAQVGTRPEASYIEVCDGLDNDADTQVDEGFPDTHPGGAKDCMDSAVDTDGDTVVNTSDTNDDDDGNPDPDFNDGVLDTTEAWTGTDSLDACPDTTSDDAWTPDFNNNMSINILDVLMFRDYVGANYGGIQPTDRWYNRRFDLNVSKSINILDVLSMGPHVGKTCTN